MGWFRLGRLLDLVSEPVIVGFTSGASLLIAATQFSNLSGTGTIPAPPDIHTLDRFLPLSLSLSLSLSLKTEQVKKPNPYTSQQRLALSILAKFLTQIFGPSFGIPKCATFNDSTQTYSTPGLDLAQLLVYLRKSTNNNLSHPQTKRGPCAQQHKRVRMHTCILRYIAQTNACTLQRLSPKHPETSARMCAVEGTFNTRRLKFRLQFLRAGSLDIPMPN